MGWFSKMPSPESAEQARANLDADRQAAKRASEERSARFWNDYARSNGPDSVDRR
ncbi:hypothetical protein [Streptomyces sp. NPDC086182]|uniref:hypothetical protein n=1 Tax=Streptomyces sp. NPDC086182 TaxID=3155058 RepID=UPI003426ABAC